MLDCYQAIEEGYYTPPKITQRLFLDWYLYDEYLKDNPDKILRVFVFSADTLKKYGWLKTIKTYPPLERIDINLNYIKEHNWLITYPSYSDTSKIK